MTGPLQLTIATASARATPDTGVDPTAPAGQPSQGVFGPGAGPSTSAKPSARPGQPGDAEPAALPPISITFGPGPAPAPTSGARTPQPDADGLSSGRGGSAGTGGGAGSGGDAGAGGGGGGDVDPGGSSGGPTDPRPGRTGRLARPGAGRRLTSGPSTGPRRGRRSSRLGQLVTRLRSGGRGGRVTTGRGPATSPARAPRPGRAAPSRSSLGWRGPLLAAWASALAGLLRSGHARASRLTPETWRVIAILVAGGLVALAGPVDIAAPASAPDSAPTSTAAPAGATTTARRVLDLAESQVGTVEGRGGGTPYHRDYGIAADQPWCAVFVWDMFREAGAADLIGPKTAYTPTLASWFRQRGQWSGTPTVGALVFYDWPDRLDRIQHVGIVESIGPNTIQTIEANTSSGVAGSQDNGGGVWRRTRPRNGSIVGYGLPAYSLHHQQP